jgi:hypothetical protein
LIAHNTCTLAINGEEGDNNIMSIKVVEKADKDYFEQKESETSSNIRVGRGANTSRMPVQFCIQLDKHIL